jgi:aspartate/methionine/tyrosine aminotransferase
MNIPSNNQESHESGDFSANRIELLRRQSHGYIDLTSANPTRQGLVFPAALLQEGARAYLNDRVYQPHPRGMLVARQAVTHYYAQRTPALHLDADQDVFMTASTSEAYLILFALLTSPGDNVLVPSLSYPLFEDIAKLFHVQLRPYHLDEHRGWRIDGFHLARIADERTKAVLCVSPHNPTGMVIRRAVPVLSLLDVPIICDEVFAEFPYGVASVPPLAALMPDLPIFTLNGISKMFALPDLKLGWIAMTPSARHRYAENLEVINDTLLGANALAQTLLPVLMRDGMAFVATQRAIITANIAMVLAQLHAAGLSVRIPDAGYYLCVELPIICDEEDVVLHLLRHGVFVHPGYFFGATLKSYLVISCLVAMPQLQQGVERLITALRLYPLMGTPEINNP